MNKNGWGLRMELVFILLFLICLVTAVIGLNKMGLLGNENGGINSTGSSTSDTTSYETLENKLVSAAKNYFNDYYDNTMNEDMIVVRLSTLHYNDYIEKITDSNGRECSGYVKIINVDGGIVYSSYLKCPKYTTSGYDGSNDW